jgi:basic membrane protein A
MERLFMNKKTGYQLAKGARTLVLVVFVVLLAACSGGGGGNAAVTYQEGLTRIAVVLYDGVVAGDAYREFCQAGFSALAEQADAHYFENANGLPFADILAQALASEPELVWCIDNRGASQMAAAAAANPTLSFVTLDYVYDEPAANLTGVSFQTKDVAFLAGYLAAATTQTGDVAYLGGADSSLNRAEEAGFKAGVVYAGNILAKGLRLHADFVGDDYNATSAGDKATALFESCDIIYLGTGNGSTGALQAATEGKYVIAGDYDRNSTGTAVLASVDKRLSERIRIVCESFSKGENIGGQNYRFGFNSQSVRFVAGASVSEDINTALRSLQSEITGGQLSVPQDQAALDAFVASKPWENS